MNTISKQGSGFGLGLRPDHYEAILNTNPPIDWLEAITENYMVPGGKPLWYLDNIRERYPIALHGVSLSLGSHDPLDREYLLSLRNLVKRVNPVRVSDHLCWTGVQAINMHDLLPLPYTDEIIDHVARRIRQVQDYLGQQILVENVSSYVTFHESGMPEWEFVARILEKADCLLLLDVNNVYVSAVNHAFNPREYLHALPANRIAQIHLAGYTDREDYLIDTHDHPVSEPVWDLYAHALERFGFVATMIERDDHIPPLDALLEELDRVRMIAGAATTERACV